MMDAIVTPVTLSRSKVPIFGLILMILATAIVGIAVGVAVGFVSQFFYLILLMPLLMTVAGGKAISSAASLGKVRSGLVAGFFGLLCGLLIYGSYRYGEYFFTRQRIHNNFAEQDSIATSTQIDELIDQKLVEEVGQPGFVGFVLSEAKEGVQVSPSHSSSASLTLPTPITWVYWLIELLVVAGGAAAVAASDANQPFCEQDNKFYVTRSIGNVAKENIDQFMTAIKGKDWRSARSLLMKNKPAYPYLELKIQKCPSCNTHPVTFQVYRKLNSKSSNDAKMLTGTIAPEQFTELEGAPAVAY